MNHIVEDFLAHHGVKGMKWGVHKDEVLLRRISGGNQLRSGAETREQRKAENAKDKQAYKDYKKSTPKAERRADRIAAQVSKGEYIVNQALKQPESLIATRDPSGMQMIMTGRELVEQMANGAAMNVKYTDIIATPN
jgi:hypothetical protein